MAESLDFTSMSENEVATLKQELEKAQAAIRVRDEFLNHAAHELRTPLTALKLQIQIRQRLLKKGDNTKFAPELLEAMFSDDNRQITRLATLIDEMLDVSRSSLRIPNR